MLTTVFVAMDIGCIECGESSAVLGICKTRAEAEAVLGPAEEKQGATWTGQHSFEVLEATLPVES